MVAPEHQLTEKMIFFWHGHWATSVQKVKSARSCSGQLRPSASRAAATSRALVKAMLRDPALIVWLDGQRNTRQAPNENLARELMELFTLGIGAYTEDDIKAGARALTGWAVDRADRGRGLVARTATTPGPRRSSARPADFDADSLRRPAGGAAGPRRRSWPAGCGSASPGRADAGRHPGPAGRRVRRRAATSPRMLRALLTDPDFAGTRGTLVKQPVEWLVGALRQLGIDPARCRTTSASSC